MLFQSTQVQSMPSTGKYSQTPEGPFYENFWYCETKNSLRKIVTPPLLQSFSLPQTSEKQKGSPRKFLGALRQNFFWKIVIPIFAWFFGTRNFQQHRNCPLTIFLSRQKVFDIFLWWPPLSSTKNFAPDKWAAPETPFNMCAYVMKPAEWRNHNNFLK